MVIDFAQSTKNPYYSYDNKRQQYRNLANGQFLAKSTILELTKKRIDSTGSDLQDIGKLLLTGKLSLKQWQVETANTLKILHTQQYLLGIGGQREIKRADYLVIARELKNQYKFFRNFAIDLTLGVMSTAQFLARLNQYTLASKISYFKATKVAASRAGLTHARRMLGQNKYHCIQCPQYAASGIVLIDDAVLPMTECDCIIQCKCDLIFGTLESLA